MSDPETPFWLFAGQDYYASGGMYDHVARFETLELANLYVATSDEKWDWWHVLDTNTWGIVTGNKGNYSGQPDEDA